MASLIQSFSTECQLRDPSPGPILNKRKIPPSLDVNEGFSYLISCIFLVCTSALSPVNFDDSRPPLKPLSLSSLFFWQRGTIRTEEKVLFMEDLKEIIAKDGAWLKSDPKKK